MRMILGLAMIVVASAQARADDEENVALDKLPKAVMDAVAKRFPKIKMTGASKEKEDGKVLYEVTLKKDDKKIDVTVTEAGAITLIEQQLVFADLPKEVAKTFEDKYPKAKFKIIESVSKVADGKETLEYYEAKLVAADGKTWEVEVLADGKFKSASEVKSGK